MPRLKREPAFLPRLRIVVGEQIAIGPGKADLLESIQRTGSIRDGARLLKMSYMRAWNLIRTMNACFNAPLVVSARGGQTRGGARLTEEGEQVLELYRQMERICMRETRREWKNLMKHLSC